MKLILSLSTLILFFPLSGYSTGLKNACSLSKKPARTTPGNQQQHGREHGQITGSGTTPGGARLVKEGDKTYIIYKDGKKVLYNVDK